MTDIYESKVEELAAEISYEIKDPYGAVLSEEMRKKVDLMKRLAKENILVRQIRTLKREFSIEFISWVNTQLKPTYVERIVAIVNPRHNPENIFYNILYYIAERFQMRVKCDRCLRLISFDMFCNLVGKNRKTLSREGTIKYTTKEIKRILIEDHEQNIGIKNIIHEIFNHIYDKLKLI